MAEDKTSKTTDQELNHSFISGMHHYECAAPNVDINLQSGWFWATSIELDWVEFNAPPDTV